MLVRDAPDTDFSGYPGILFYKPYIRLFSLPIHYTICTTFMVIGVVQYRKFLDTVFRELVASLAGYPTIAITRYTDCHIQEPAGYRILKDWFYPA